MPQILPTPDELRRLSPSQRARARRAVARIALELDRVAAQGLRQQQRDAELQDWGKSVRERARHLESLLEPEPDHVIRQRQAALLEAMR